jgi:MFS family permease
MSPRPRCDPAPAAAAAWCALGLGLALYGLYFPHAHTVYDIYARAARRWWAGDDLYQAAGTDFFRYSPLFAVALTPCALLPGGWGNALWRLVNCVAYAAGLGAWARRVVPADLGRRECGLLFLFALPASLHSLYNAQANLLMLGAVLLGLAAAAGGRWNRSAGCLALATLIKGYPLALALLVCAGMSNLASQSIAQTLVQLLAPPEKRGRVVGVYNMSSSGLRVGSGFTVGVLGGFIGIHWSLGASSLALCLIVIGLLVYTTRAALRAPAASVAPLRPSS